MQVVTSVQYLSGSREEMLPGYSQEFPYLSSRAELHRYLDRSAPWHWHHAVELFYMEKGTLRYETPGGTWIFEEGTGGLINSDVLHQSSFLGDRASPCIQLLHIFDPQFLGSAAGEKVFEKYIHPIVSDPSLDVIQIPKTDQKMLQNLHDSFYLDPDEFGYEMHLRAVLSDLWLGLFNYTQTGVAHPSNEGKLKQMLLYIHDHFDEKLRVEDIARAAFLSERQCYRCFQDILHTTPVGYVVDYRLGKAEQMLKEPDRSISEVAYACGFGSSSYFGKAFFEKNGITPSDFRRMEWISSGDK